MSAITLHRRAFVVSALAAPLGGWICGSPQNFLTDDAENILATDAGIPLIADSDARTEIDH
jgi:hypothetical protein